MIGRIRVTIQDAAGLRPGINPDSPSSGHGEVCGRVAVRRVEPAVSTGGRSGRQGSVEEAETEANPPSEQPQRAICGV